MNDSVDYQNVLSILRSIPKKYVKICADMETSDEIKNEVKEDLEFCMMHLSSDTPMVVKNEAINVQQNIMKSVDFLYKCKNLGW